MRSPRTLPLSLAALLALAACQDDATLLTVETPGPGIEETGPAPPRMNPNSPMTVEGYPDDGEVRTGFIYDRGGAPLEITYEVHEGLAIWQGDIILGESHEIAASPAELSSSAPGPLRGVVIDADGGNNRWPGGIVPYTVDASDPPTQSIVDGAIDWIEDQTPGVTLVPRSGQSDYVNFKDSGGCSSEIGRIGGKQDINLKVDDGTSLCTTGNAAHEILHALGMFHEQSRCDRDSFVTIDLTQVESGKEGNFDKECSGATDLLAYDFGSIMHYPVDAFATGSSPTIIPIVPVPAGVTIGQRGALSDTDAETIDLLYGTNNAGPVASISGPTGDLLEGSSLVFDGTGSSDADDDDDLLVFSWIFGDGTCPGPTACSDAATSHAYADNGTYGYQLEVTDGWDTGAAGSTVTILNVAPTVDAGADLTLDEGDQLSRPGSFDDPGADTWTATVDYGEGAGVEGLALAGKSFTLQNLYEDNPASPATAFTVEVVVDDDDGGSDTDQVQVTVNNVAPTVNAGPDAEVESGETYDFSGTFSDPGIVDDPWAWVIAWGDGTADDSGDTSDQSAPIQASHQVCTAGTYTVGLSVTDKDGGMGSDDLSLTVPYVVVDVDIMPGTDLNPINLKKRGNVPVAILGSAELDVADIDPSSLTLGDETDPDTSIGQKNNGTYEAYMEDVNGDGYMDLVAMFPNRDLVDQGELTELSHSLVLRGYLADACTNFRGEDMVAVRPPS